MTEKLSTPIVLPTYQVHVRCVSQGFSRFFDALFKVPLCLGLATLGTRNSDGHLEIRGSRKSDGHLEIRGSRKSDGHLEIRGSMGTLRSGDPENKMGTLRLGDPENQMGTLRLGDSENQMGTLIPVTQICQCLRIGCNRPTYCTAPKPRH